MKIAILKEEKTPPDSRVVLTPLQVKNLIEKGYDIEVMRSDGRCFPDSAYESLGIPMINEISDHDILIGVKEVPKENIIPEKTYFMFSHTIKEQPYNKELIRTIASKNSTLIDYEVLTNEKGARVIAFGKFAGMVGAHNAVYTYGEKTGDYHIPRMHTLSDYNAAKDIYKKLDLPPFKIVLTGTGRVSGGAAQVLLDMGIKQVSPLDYLSKLYDYPVFTQLSAFYYAKRKDGKVNENIVDFFNHPEEYTSQFDHFTKSSDIMINGIYWNPSAPAFFTKEEMNNKDFKIKVIADVTCDIAPESSIPSTLKASTISDPVFGYDTKTHSETDPFQDDTVDMMTIDNLPNELPVDASTAFGEMFIEHVLPELSRINESNLIEKATIIKNGQLGKHFDYLKEYAGF